MRMTTRRRFLVALGGVGALAALPLGLQWSRQAGGGKAASPELAGGLRVFRETGYALGSEVALVVVHTDETTARGALRAAFEELRSVERIMSIYLPESQLSQLNREGVLINPHRYMVDILEQSQALAEKSDGAFDVTVQPLWDLYAGAYKGGHSPTEGQIAATLECVGYRNLHVAAERIKLQKRGSLVVLNGIAQGYAADRVMDTLRAHGITQALINTGEIGSLGHNQNDRPWRMGIQHPRQENAYIALADLDGRSLATSGDYNTTFTPDRRDNHIFDPATGHSPTQLASVSVVAPTTALADGLSTALFVTGVDKGLQLINKMPNTDALFVLKDGTVMSTAHFPRVNA